MYKRNMTRIKKKIIARNWWDIGINPITGFKMFQQPKSQDSEKIYC
jgi:hypothetical protein